MESKVVFYQNPDSSDAAILEGDFTNWGADPSQMDLTKMKNLIITAYPTTITGKDNGIIASEDELPKNAKSGDVASINSKKYIYSGLENKWVEGYDLNNKKTKNAYTYLHPLTMIIESVLKNGGGTLYLPKGIYENQIRFSGIEDKEIPRDFLRDFRILGDGEENSIIDTSYIGDSNQIHFENTAISISASEANMTGLKNIIISDLTIKAYGQSIDIYSHTHAIGDNILLRNLKIIKVSQNYYSLISFNRSLLMGLSRVTLDNINTGTLNDGFCMHELAFFKGKYIKIHHSHFDARPSEYNIDMHTHFTEISDSMLVKTKSSGRPNIKFPGSDYVLFNHVHFKSLSEREGNIMVSSSPEKYRLHFEDCIFETASPAIFTTLGHIGYGVKQLVLKNNIIMGPPTEFQVYGADKVFLKGNTKAGDAVDVIVPFTYERYKLTSWDFAPLNRIKEIQNTEEGIGYKSWDTKQTPRIIRDFTLINTDLSIDKKNIHVANTNAEFEKLVSFLNKESEGGYIRIEKGTEIVVDAITLKKVGIIGEGSLVADKISVAGESYIGDGLTLKIQDKILVDGTFELTKANVEKSSQMGAIIEGENQETKIIIRASEISGGKDIIVGKALFVTINGESILSGFEKSAVDISTGFLNMINVTIEGGEYGVFVGDVKNVFLKLLLGLDTKKLIFLSYHRNTKVIEISDIDTNTDIQVVADSSFDSELVDFSIGRLKKSGSYLDVEILSPNVEFAYSYNGVTLTPAPGKHFQRTKHETGGGNISPHHIPLGYFPAEWNYLNPTETSFPRPN